MAFAPPVWFAVLDELVGGGGTDGSTPISCFDDFDDDALFATFHLTRPCIRFITDNIELRMKKHAKIPGLSVEAMAMVALNYYAQGASSAAIQERIGVNYSQIPEVVCTISKVIASMADQFISFPVTRSDRANIACKTEKLCGIPRVLGVVAAAHFKIRASPYEKDTFRSFLNTLGYTSVMSQLICDSDGNILSAEMCSVGSTPEQEMWGESFKGRELEGGMHGQYWVIGGRGYHLSERVLTAVAQPENAKEVAFNEAHAKVHSVMRTTLGSIKRRFKCLMQLGFAQENSLEKKAEIIKGCCVLHNIAKKFSVPTPPVVGKIEPLHPSFRHQISVVESKPEALKAREELINRFSAASSRQAPPVTGSNAVEDV